MRRAHARASSDVSPEAALADEPRSTLRHLATSTVAWCNVVAVADVADALPSVRAVGSRLSWGTAPARTPSSGLGAPRSAWLHSAAMHNGPGAVWGAVNRRAPRWGVVLLAGLFVAAPMCTSPPRWHLAAPLPRDQPVPSGT